MNVEIPPPPPVPPKRKAHRAKLRLWRNKDRSLYKKKKKGIGPFRPALSPYVGKVISTFPNTVAWCAFEKKELTSTFIGVIVSLRSKVPGYCTVICIMKPTGTKAWQLYQIRTCDLMEIPTGRLETVNALYERFMEWRRDQRLGEPDVEACYFEERRRHYGGETEDTSQDKDAPE